MDYSELVLWKFDLVTGGSPTVLMQTVDKVRGEFQVSSDGRYLATQILASVSNKDDVNPVEMLFWDLKNETSVSVPIEYNGRVLLGEVSPYYNSDETTISWNPTGSKVAVAHSWENSIRIYNSLGVEIQNIVVSEADRPSYIRDLHWNSEGSKIVFLNHDRNRLDEYDRYFSYLEDMADIDRGIYVADLVAGTIVKLAGINPESMVDDDAWSYHISTWDGSSWIERTQLHYGYAMSDQWADLSGHLPDADGEYKVRIKQVGLEEAHVDEIVLEYAHRHFASPSAVTLLSGTVPYDLTQILRNRDRNIMDLHEKEIEVYFLGGETDGTIKLHMTAREASFEGVEIEPLHFPNIEGYYEYRITGQASLSMDGVPDSAVDSSDPVFSQFSTTDTGHQPGYVTGHILSDDTHLYAAFDFSVDNAYEDNGDWASLTIQSSSGVQNFRVSTTELDFGVVGFNKSLRSDYGHKYYEFKISLDLIGSTQGDEIAIRFNGYGSAGDILNPATGPSLLNHRGDLMWLSGGREPTYYYRNSRFLGNNNDYLGAPRHERMYPFTAYSLSPDTLVTTPLLVGDLPVTTHVTDTISGLERIWPSATKKRLMVQNYDDEESCLPNQYDVAKKNLWTVESLENLYVSLRAIRSSSRGGILLEGTAMDLNFSHYTLEYAYRDDADQWFAIMPSSDLPVTDDRFTTWVPPGVGGYFVRLSIFDSAGNQRSVVESVSWTEGSSIAGVYTEPNYFSPNGDLIIDQLNVHYKVLQPINLAINVIDEYGQTIRTIERSHSTIGEEVNVVWDGRNNEGLVVSDGQYKIIVQNYEYLAWVDNEAPVIDDLSSDWVAEYIDPGWGVLGYQLEKFFEFSLGGLAESTVMGGNDWKVSEKSVVPLRGKFSLSPAPTLEHLVSEDYRITAVDIAGNSTTIELDGERKRGQIFISDFGKHLNEFDFVKAISGSPNSNYLVKENDYSSAQYYTNGVVSINFGLLRVTLQETVVADIQEVWVDYKESVSDLWNSVRIDTFITVKLKDFPDALNNDCQIVECYEVVSDSVIPQHRLQFIWDASSLSAGTGYDYKVRVVSANQDVISSNIVKISNGDWLSIKGILPEVAMPGPGARFGDGYSVVRDDVNSVVVGATNLDNVYKASLRVESRTDSRFFYSVDIETLVFGDIGFYPMGDDSYFEFDGEFQEPCHSYSYSLVLQLENGDVEVSNVLGQSIPCIDIKYWTEPKYTECGAEPTSLVDLHLWPKSETDSIDLSLLTVSIPETGDQLEDILFNVNDPTANEHYTYTIDTSAYDEGVKKLWVTLHSSSGDITRYSVMVAVDRQPPEIEISSPLAFEKVCGSAFALEFPKNIFKTITSAEVSTVLADNRIPSFGRTNISELEWRENHYDQTWSYDNSVVTEWDPLRSRDIDYKLMYRQIGGQWRRPDEAGADRILRLPSGTVAFKATPRPFISGRQNLIGFSGLVGNELNESIEMSLTVVDAGGNVQCLVREFELDAVVDGVSLMLSGGVKAKDDGDITIFSPNGDELFDELVLNFSALENTQLSAEIFPASVNLDGLDLPEPVGIMFQALDFVPGAHVLNWNGVGVDQPDVLADGKYNAVFKITDGCGNVKKIVIRFEIDTTSPTVEINYPLFDSPLALMIEIKASMSDINVHEYLLTYEVPGELDVAVILAAEEIEKGIQEEIIATWNTFELQGGYGLTLTAIDLVGNVQVVTVDISLEDRVSLISSFSLSEPFFTGLEGVGLGPLSILGSIENPAELTLEIINSQDAIVRQLLVDASFGRGPILQLWDGKNTAGLLLPDGEYTIRLTAVLTLDNNVRQIEEVTVQLDSTPPVVDVISVNEGYLLKGDQLVASIVDANMERYWVYGSSGIDSPEWLLLATGRNEISEKLLATFGSESYPDGEYLLKTVLIDKASNEVVEVWPMVIDRVLPTLSVSQPKNNKVYINRNSLDVLGIFDDLNFSNYRVEYGEGADPESWSEIYSGETKPDNTLLASWSLDGGTDGVDEVDDGVISIRVTVMDKANNTSVQTIPMVLDGTNPLVQLDVTDYLDADGVVSGSVDDQNLDFYQLSYRLEGLESWQPLFQGNKNVQNDLLVIWNDVPEDGRYEIRLEAKDVVELGVSVNATLTIDRTNPDSPQFGTIEARSSIEVLVSWTPSVALDVIGYELTMRGALVSNELITGVSYSVTVPGDGSYQFSLVAVDAAGNKSEVVNSNPVIVDFTPPNVVISSPAESAVVRGMFSIRGTAVGENDLKEYSLFYRQVGETAWSLLSTSIREVFAEELTEWNTLSLNSEQDYELRLYAVDTRGNENEVTVVVSIDNTPPNAPTNLQLSISVSDATVSWDENSESDIAGYILFRNDRPVLADKFALQGLSTYLTADLNYVDAGLVDGEHSYRVYAMDNAGNMSEDSTPVSIDLDLRSPVITIVSPSVGELFENSLFVQTESEDLDIASVQFEYSENGGTWELMGDAILLAPFNIQWDSTAISYGNVDIRVIAVDRSANTGTSAMVNLIKKDLVSPSIPTGLVAQSNSSEITVSWNAVDDLDISRYEVHITNLDTGVTNNWWTTGVETSLTFIESGDDGQYDVAVLAQDVDLNKSALSTIDQVSLFSIDLQISRFIVGVETDEQAVVDISVTSGVGGLLQISILNEDQTEVLPEVAAIVGEEIMLPGVRFQLGSNIVEAVVVNEVGDISRKSNRLVLRGEIPVAPQGLVSSINDYDLSLDWDDNVESDLLGYLLYQDGVLAHASIQTPVEAATSSHDEYSYNYRPYRAVDNFTSTYWSPQLDGSPILFDVQLEQGSLVSAVSISWVNGCWAKEFEILGWIDEKWVKLSSLKNNELVQNVFEFERPVYADRVAIRILSPLDYSRYQDIRLIEFKVTGIDSYTTTSQLETIINDGVSEFQVSAISTLGIESEKSLPVTVGAGDVIAPSPPVNLTAYNFNTGDVDLSWESAEGEHFNIYRAEVSGGGYNVIGNVVVASFIDSDTVLGEAYYYVVTALDLANNESDYSNEVSAVPVDLLAPARPTIVTPTTSERPLSIVEKVVHVAGYSEPGIDVYAMVNGSVQSKQLANKGLVENILALFEIQDWSMSSDGNSLAVVDGRYNSEMILFSLQGELSSKISYARDYLSSVLHLDDKVVVLDDGDALRFYELDVVDVEGISIPIPGVNRVYDIMYRRSSHSILAVGRDDSYDYKIWEISVAGDVIRELDIDDYVSSSDLYYFTISPDGKWLINPKKLLVNLETGDMQTLNQTVSNGQWSAGSAAFVMRQTNDTEYVLRTLKVPSLEVLDVVLPNVLNDFSLSATGTEFLYSVYKAEGDKREIWIGLVDGTDFSDSISIEENSSLVYTTDSVSAYSISWLEDGKIVWKDNSGLRILSPEGRFVFDDVQLESGINYLSAYSVDRAGNLSDDSLPIELIVDQSGLADLSISLSLNPEIAVIDATTNINLEIVYLGNGADLATDYSLKLIDPNGNEFELLEVTELSSIASGESFVTTVSWSPTETGNYYLVARIDSQGVLEDANLGNNTVVMSVPVFNSGSQVLSVDITSSIVSSGGSVSLSGDVLNAGSLFTGSLSINVEDIFGELVDNVATFSIDQLSYGDDFEFLEPWLPQGIFAGNYRIRITLKDADNVLVEEKLLEVELIDQLLVSALLATSKTEFSANETVAINATIVNDSITSLLSNAQVLFSIENATAQSMIIEGRTLTNVLPNDSEVQVFNWNTVQFAPGDYTAIMSVRVDDDELLSEELTFTIAPSLPLLKGSFEASTNTARAGDAVLVSQSVSHDGNVALTNVNARIEIIDSSSQLVVSVQSSQFNLEVSGEHIESMIFDTSALAVGIYQYRLVGEVIQDDINYVSVLATSNLVIVDGTAPVLQIINPVAGSFVGDSIDVLLKATDLDSAIESVLVQLDGGDWKEAVFNGQYHALNNVTLSSGEHELSAKAKDSAGNESAVISSVFEVDVAEPLIVITGVADGQYYPGDIQATVSITDINLTESTILLNGVTYVSGDVIPTAGQYQLEVTALDAAGNASSESLWFEIDTLAPVIVFTDISGGSYYSYSVTPTISVTEDNLLSSVITLNGDAYVDGTTISAEGDYSLVVIAEDLAGNVTIGEVAFVVDMTSPLIPIVFAPVDGSVVNEPTVDVVGTAEADAIVRLASPIDLFEAIEITAASDGSFIFSAIPFSDGTHVIEVGVRDRAGNQSELVTVSFSIQQNEGFSIEVLSAPTPRILLWIPENSSQSGVIESYITMFESNIRNVYDNEGYMYKVVSDEQSFISEMRSLRYNVIFMLDALGHIFTMAEQTTQEIRAQVLAGSGLIYIDVNGTSPLAFDDVLGLSDAIPLNGSQIIGSNLYIPQLDLGSNPATSAYSFSLSNFYQGDYFLGDRLTLSTGVAYGDFGLRCDISSVSSACPEEGYWSLTPTEQNFPLVLNSYSRGSSALVNFLPLTAFSVNPALVLQFINELTLHVVPKEQEYDRGPLYELRWKVTGLSDEDSYLIKQNYTSDSEHCIWADTLISEIGIEERGYDPEVIATCVDPREVTWSLVSSGGGLIVSSLMDDLGEAYEYQVSLSVSSATNPSVAPVNSNIVLSAIDNIAPIYNTGPSQPLSTSGDLLMTQLYQFQGVGELASGELELAAQDFQSATLQDGATSEGAAQAIMYMADGMMKLKLMEDNPISQLPVIGEYMMYYQKRWNLLMAQELNLYLKGMLGSSNMISIGEILNVHGMVLNISSVSLSSVTSRLQLINLNSQAVVNENVSVNDFGIDAIQGISAQFATDSFVAGDYELRLVSDFTYNSVSYGFILATQSLSLIDDTAPVIIVSGVVDGQYYMTVEPTGDGQIYMAVEPTIAIFDNDLAEYSILLNGEVYISGTIIFAPGQYQLVVSAQDGSGNISTESIWFELDSSTPQISVVGVVNDVYYNSSVIPIITVTDSNVGTTDVTLNGAEFVVGASIIVEGEYSLSVLAQDLAGNQSSLVVNFVIDLTVPAIPIVSSPAESSSTSSNVIDVIGSSEAGSIVQLVYGESTAPITTIADSSGSFSFSAVPFESGPHTIYISAEDRAGNVSDLTTVNFSVDQEEGVAISILSNPTPRVLIWIPGSGGGIPSPVESFESIVRTTYDNKGYMYNVVNNETAFIKEMRSLRYNVFLLLDASSQILSMDVKTVQEVRAQVLAGNGIIYIDVNGNSTQQFDDVLGVTSVAPLNSVVASNEYVAMLNLSATPATSDYSIVLSSIDQSVEYQGEKLTLSTGIPYGELGAVCTPVSSDCSGDFLSLTAVEGNYPLVLNNYGRGKSALVNFLPLLTASTPTVELLDQNEQLIDELTQHVVPSIQVYGSGPLYELRWRISGLGNSAVIAKLQTNDLWIWEWVEVVINDTESSVNGYPQNYGNCCGDPRKISWVRTSNENEWVVSALIRYIPGGSFWPNYELNVIDASTEDLLISSTINPDYIAVDVRNNPLDQISDDGSVAFTDAHNFFDNAPNNASPVGAINQMSEGLIKLRLMGVNPTSHLPSIGDNVMELQKLWHEREFDGTSWFW